MQNFGNPVLTMDWQLQSPSRGNQSFKVYPEAEGVEAVPKKCFVCLIFAFQANHASESVHQGSSQELLNLQLILACFVRSCVSPFLDSKATFCTGHLRRLLSAATNEYVLCMARSFQRSCVCHGALTGMPFRAPDASGSEHK